MCFSWTHAWNEGEDDIFKFGPRKSSGRATDGAHACPIPPTDTPENSERHLQLPEHTLPHKSLALVWRRPELSRLPHSSSTVGHSTARYVLQYYAVMNLANLAGFYAAPEESATPSPTTARRFAGFERQIFCSLFVTTRRHAPPPPKPNPHTALRAVAGAESSQDDSIKGMRTSIT